MELDICGEISPNASGRTVREALQAMGRCAEPFVVLARDTEHFMQVLIYEDDKYSLEYHAGGPEEHFVCPRTDLTLDVVTALFLLYLEEDERWQSSVPWERTPVPE